MSASPAQSLPPLPPPSTETEDELLAAQKHALLLIQDNQVEAADTLLRAKGFTHRLATCVLRYPMPGDAAIAVADPVEPRPFVRAADDALPPAMLSFMQHAFSSADSPFWAAHQYSVEPPSPYFSYVHDLSQPPATGLDDVIHYLRQLALARFPAVKRATFAEWWTHCRPHSSGHQFHFDSADEGRGGVRNPIVSTVMFLEAPCGGPTVVTDQKFGFPKLGRHGWLVHANANRFVVFNGKTLHGVVPGRGAPPESQTAAAPQRRVTFMVAFWDFDVRQGPVGPGERPASAMPLDWDDDAEWMARLRPRCHVDNEAGEVEVAPVAVPHVWERTDGAPLDNKMPGYDACFQGF
ncbi:Aste57867_22462 [Aphanomyces stellatus]|uniref:Aste57867_22462 protein n=1 Tax=Aphanomyces stellatus TaxID=120398 RepID=A0A485LKE6_9STRA|nr:hypothetical protein As57867_022392 [Aphanomyces stellatus]VFT99122.1 Aste57867_22462 [Aphanomyces stellatus]